MTQAGGRRTRKSFVVVDFVFEMRALDELGYQTALR